MAGRVQHIVLLKFPSELGEDDVAEMYAHVRSWPDQIPGFTKLRLGRDVSGRSLGYQYLLVTEFENEEALQAYFPHPVHQRFAQWGPLARHRGAGLRLHARRGLAARRGLTPLDGK